MTILLCWAFFIYRHRPGSTAPLATSAVSADDADDATYGDEADSWAEGETDGVAAAAIGAGDAWDESNAGDGVAPDSETLPLPPPRRGSDAPAAG